MLRTSINQTLVEQPIRSQLINIRRNQLKLLMIVRQIDYCVRREFTQPAINSFRQPIDRRGADLQKLYVLCRGLRHKRLAQ